MNVVRDEVRKENLTPDSTSEARETSPKPIGLDELSKGFPADPGGLPSAFLRGEFIGRSFAPFISTCLLPHRRAHIGT